MFVKTITTALILLLAKEGKVVAFSSNKPSVVSRYVTPVEEPLSTHEEMPTIAANERREFLEKGLAMLSVSALGMAMGSSPVWADVSDGNSLPQGAAQFSRVIRAKTDLLGVQKRVESGASEMDKAEWNNVGAFLRRVYGVSEDMKAISSGFTDSAKKQRASELIDNLKKFSKAADAPTGTQNGTEFLAYAKKLTSILDEFLGLLSDVPDEI